MVDSGVRPVSRQRRWQLKQIQNGLCIYCPSRAVVRGYCDRHYKIKQERNRRRYAKRKKAK